MKILQPILVSILMASCTSALHVHSDGLVNYAGRQADIVGQNNIRGSPVYHAGSWRQHCHASRYRCLSDFCRMDNQ